MFAIKNSFIALVKPASVSVSLKYATKAFASSVFQIKSEITPNENSRKYSCINNNVSFTDSRMIVEVSRDDPSTFQYSVLANFLLKYIKDLDSVMISQKFVTCTKYSSAVWLDNDKQIAEVLSDYLKYQAHKSAKALEESSKEQMSTDMDEVSYKLFEQEEQKIKELVNKLNISEEESKELKEKFQSEYTEEDVEKAKKAASDKLNTELFSNFKFRELDDFEKEIEEDVLDLLETRIKPNLMEDGGDISYQGYDPDTGTIFVKLHGSCKSCSLSSATLQDGVENMIKHYIPEINKVQQVLSEQDEQSALQLKKLEEKNSKN
ncbi:uncharacterized protein HGUI_03167 [Hanseniaspora guilliermondii]|uniref:Scaffold protein Nfu/NifU N-terminal domain-containing protein n=1 Tax=Hanseniaspora guilliermondii TaxID=56406 RepID=A0A1L0D1G0_9ASCO|nr:uncharacterized protein HGUI_03167 [Hanseniaspora guilliermondii]